MNKVSDWLASQGLGKYESVFAENSIAWALMPKLTADDLKELGLNIGERRQFLEAASALGNPAADSAPGTSTSVGQAAGEAERRQLTVMFCDLVGSTALSGQLDPEDLREVIRSYQKSAEAVIQQYGGHIAQYLGDGLLVYFGYPVAHEDDAQRAVYAGVGIPKTIHALNTQLQADHAVSLSVRIGIHTGPVVVGEMGGNARRENLAMGETPNLAARLEALAEPDAIVISEGTRRLLGELFELAPLGEQTFKGIATPVTAFAVTGERLAETRFAAGQSDGMSAMVGRQQELALLLDRWRQAKAGEGQLVVLTGDAGIGKSRIMSALVAAIKPEDHVRISYQCSPYHTDSALYPAIAQLSYAAGFDANEPPDAKLGKLERLLHQGQDDIRISTPLLGALLGLGEVAEARYGALAYSPQQRREGTLKALLELLTGVARKRPVLFVLEDAHWIDPTTLELIELALEQIGGHRIMMLITARPTFNHGFGGHPVVSRLTLNRLGRKQIVAIVDRITKGKALPSELLDEITAKTDGVPLFVEEFTKTLLESGQLRETDQGYEFDGRLDQLAIPSSLHDSLMARLDRMQPIKEVAQAAACIGREFGYAPLAAVSPLPQAELTAALDQLVAAELIFKRGVPPVSTYTFKHALVRDAAYESLLKARRQTLHDGLLTYLEAAGDAAAEILAHHAEQAGRSLPAARYWQLAGEVAVSRSGYNEAIAHLRAALDQLALVPESNERMTIELALRVKIGPALAAIKGLGASESSENYQRACAIADRLGDSAEGFMAMWGDWNSKISSGRIREAAKRSDDLVGLSRRLDHEDFVLQAHHSRWTNFHNMGDARLSRADTQIGVRMYDIERHRHHRHVYGGHDPGICACGVGANAAWLTGHADEASVLVERAVAISEKIEHAFSECLVWFWATQAAWGVRDHTLARERAQALLRVAETHSFRMWLGTGMIVSGACQVHAGETGFGLKLVEEGLDKQRQFGLSTFYGYLCAIAATGYLEAGNSARALELLAEAVDAHEKTGAANMLPDTMRLRAEALLAAREIDVPQAIAHIEAAVGVAQQQGALALEWRATSSMARLHASHGRDDLARSLLHARFSVPLEGFESPDLVEGKQLLDTMG